MVPEDLAGTPTPHGASTVTPARKRLTGWQGVEGTIRTLPASPLTGRIGGRRWFRPVRQGTRTLWLAQGQGGGSDTGVSSHLPGRPYSFFSLEKG